jgi:hypothetical protein
VTDPTTPPDESAEASVPRWPPLPPSSFGDGLTPAELNEIGRRAGEAVRDAAREHWQGGMSEENTRAWFEAAVSSFVHVLRSSGRH